MSTLANYVQIALRLVQSGPDISKLWPRVTGAKDDVDKIWQRVQAVMKEVDSTMISVRQLAADVEALARKVAPELLPAGRAAPTPKYDVRWLQTSLKSLGFDPGAVDGVMGPRTIEAIKKFQGENGLVVDGWAGVATEAKLDELLRRA